MNGWIIEASKYMHPLKFFLNVSTELSVIRTMLSLAAKYTFGK